MLIFCTLTTAPCERLPCISIARRPILCEAEMFGPRFFLG